MAIVVNKAGYAFTVMNENKVTTMIPFDHRAYEVTDWTFTKYRELLKLVAPMKQNIPIIEIQKPVIDPIQLMPSISIPIPQSEIKKIEDELLVESKPLKGSKISISKRKQLKKTRPTGRKKIIPVVESDLRPSNNSLTNDPYNNTLIVNVPIKDHYINMPQIQPDQSL